MLQALVWPRRVELRHVLAEDTPEVSLAEDEDVEHEAPDRPRGIDVVPQGDELDAARLEKSHYVEQVGERAADPVELRYDYGADMPRAYVREETLECRTIDILRRDALLPVESQMEASRGGVILQRLHLILERIPVLAHILRARP